MQESGQHQLRGHAKAAHWAEKKLGMADSTARALVLAGNRLEQLPKIEAAFLAGELSWSKAQRIAAIATPETEDEWIDAAKAHGCRRIEAMVTRARTRGDVRPRADQPGLAEPQFTFRARLDALQRAKLETVKEKLSREQGRAIGDEELLEVAMETLLRAPAQPGDGDQGAERTRHDSLYRVVVQRCPASGDAAVATQDGPVEITAEAAAIVCCDAPALDPERPPQREEEKQDTGTPAWLREAVLARDGFRCRCCGARSAVQVHHVALSSQGGVSRARNLLALCSGCHGRLHAGFVRIKGDARTARFCDRDWQPIDVQVRFAPVQVVVVPGAERQDVSRAAAVAREPAAAAPAAAGPAAAAGPDSRETHDLPTVVGREWWQDNAHRVVWRGGRLRFLTARSTACSTA